MTPSGTGPCWWPCLLTPSLFGGSGGEPDSPDLFWAWSALSGALQWVLWGSSMGCGEHQPEVVPTCWARSTPGLRPITGAFPQSLESLAIASEGPVDQVPTRDCPHTPTTHGKPLFPPASLTGSFPAEEKPSPDLNLCLCWALSP